MIYNIMNTSAIGKQCRVFSAAGFEIPYVVECDTETGFVEQLEVNSLGQFCLNQAKDGIKRIFRHHPAPLRIEWIHDNERSNHSPTTSRPST